MRHISLIVILVFWLSSLAFAQSALESPASDAILSGIGFISGWKCHAGTITVTIDDGPSLPVAQHQERGDLRAKCGTINHGFIRQMNWALLGDGEHEVVAYDNGVEFGRATFSVGTVGEEFLEDVTKQTVIEGFPTPGQRTLLEWNESTQHFEVVTVWGDALTEYDRAYWQQYNADLAAGTFATPAFLYVEEPDVAVCYAGELTVGAKNRALEATNQIRALHGLPAVRYSRSYDQEVQQAALIQAASGSLTHHPDPSAPCYTEAGAAGSRGNLSSLTIDGRGVAQDPASDMVGWTNDAFNLSLLAAAGHRRWVLNPFVAQFAYGQVEGYSVHKTGRFDTSPVSVPEATVDFVAFPFRVYPFNLVEDDPPWSLSMIEDTDRLWGNRHDYFRAATITVTRVADATELVVTDWYTDTVGFGVPNFLSWQVQGWEHDILYDVTIDNIAMQSGEVRSVSYPVFIEREGLRSVRPYSPLERTEEEPRQRRILPAGEGER